MQIFVPYPSLKESVICLDNSRIGNQVYRECKTLIQDGWIHHPAYKVWAGYQSAIAQYSLYGLKEALRRRIINETSYIKHTKFFKQYIKDEVTLPPWFGNPKVHTSHRSNLLRKDYKYYSQYGWTEPPDLPYYWTSQ